MMRNLFHFFAILILILTGHAHANTDQVAVPPNQTKQTLPERDPMVPTNPHLFKSGALVERKKVIRNPFKVVGTGSSAKGHYVVMNGRVYTEGETKGDITVVKITQTHVDILINGIPETLSVE